MKTEVQWVPLDDLNFAEIDAIKEFIYENICPGGDVYIFRNSSELKNHGVHYGRIKFSKELSKKSFNKLRKKGYDLVFLYIQDNPVTYDIIKLEQKEKESVICKVAGDNGFGPVFKDSFRSPLSRNTDYIVESFLSYKAGWYPVYLQQKTIKRHYNMFLDSFGELISTMHKNKIVFNDVFWKHTFYNPLGHRCRLVDFGNSYRSDNSEQVYDEILRIHEFLSELFPKKEKKVISAFDRNYDAGL
ncbi:MAG: hypothetical protein U9P44_02305 [archaeon]|nr:hypothetical protein [archaeon]